MNLITNKNYGILFTLYILLTTVGHTQEQPDFNKFARYKSVNLYTGYNYSFGDPHGNNFHLLDIGVNKAVFGGRHGGGFQYGLGTEIALNTHHFTMGPKITAHISTMGLTIGSELITYTDFNNYTLRYVPYIGIGGEKLRITINPHVILTNKKYQPIDKGAVTIVFNLALKREAID